MKSIVLSSVVMALLVFSGCSSKEPAVDTVSTSANQVQEVPAVITEVVTTEDSMVNSNSNAAANMSMSDIENKLPTIYFAFDKFNIKPDMETKITKAVVLGKNQAEAYSVKLEGNCDEWGSDEYNFALGLKRANAVKQAIVAEGIEASRISMVSYGESNPVCTDKTQACWAKNRRVNFKLLP